MARSDLTLRGLLSAQYTKQQHPYKPSHHLGWVDALLARSDATAQRCGLRAAILQARDQRANRFQVMPMPQIFEVFPDGTVTEVDTPERPDTTQQIKKGFLIGALAALPFVVPLVTGQIARGRPRKKARRR